LADRSGYGDVLHGQQIAEMKVQSDAEHQQDDADLGQLMGDLHVADKARRMRADQHSGHQITDDRRKPQSLGK
jgi:hypothetical protein